MISQSACPLCDSERTEHFLDVPDHFLSKETFRLRKCSSCGFIFTSDAPSESEIGKYYDSPDYLSHNDESNKITDRLYRFVRSIMLDRKRSLVEKISGRKNGRLLDIGSGSGYFPAAMKKSGWEAEGIEISDKARESSVSRFGLQVYIPEEINKLATESYDCITLWHVLEHFNDPYTYANEILRLLKPGGTCIVALPDSDSYDAQHYGSFWAAYDVPRHLWHFSEKTFRIFAEKIGFRFVGTRTLPLDVFYISYMSEKYRNATMPFLRGMLRGKIWFLKCLFRKEKSSSLIYILRKN